MTISLGVLKALHRRDFFSPRLIEALKKSDTTSVLQLVLWKHINPNDVVDQLLKIEPERLAYYWAGMDLSGEGRAKIFQHITTDPDGAAVFALRAKKRMPELEPQIAKSRTDWWGYLTHLYPEGERWKDIEPRVIKKGIYESLYYAKMCFPEFLSNPSVRQGLLSDDGVQVTAYIAHRYGGFPEAENLLKQHPTLWRQYQEDLEENKAML